MRAGIREASARSTRPTRSSLLVDFVPPRPPGRGRASLSSMEVDPVLSLLVGALGASLIGLLGAWVQSRREHKRWVRAERLQAYREFLQLAEVNSPIERTLDDLSAHLSRLGAAFATVQLVGPNEVERCARAHFMAANNYDSAHNRAHSLITDDDADDEALAKAMEKLEVETQKQIRTRHEFVLSVRRALGFQSSSMPGDRVRASWTSIRSRLSRAGKSASRDRPDTESPT